MFGRAMEVLDAAGIPAEEWTFGGGTTLAFRFNHRVSRGVDIFLTDAQLLLLATPRLNANRLLNTKRRHRSSSCLFRRVW